ncbi:MAG: DUF2232 domain-containing protein [Desulfobulbus sp.]|jgi:uncharacterized protein YybS (DUF2232 family)|nr:DUF2232 domain-containing protein [Desulfobulbaceae bacterium]
MQMPQQGFKPALLLGGLFVLPLAVPAMFAWLDVLLAAVVCCTLVLLGWRPGLRQLGFGLGGAALIALVLQQLELFLFSLSACPLGMVLAKGIEQQESVAKSGARGLVALGLAWLFFWFLFAQWTQTNPYQGMLESLDKGLAATLALYSGEESGLSAETREQVETLIAVLRARLPQLLPALWLGMATITVWVNMVLANWFLGRLRSGAGPWGLYRSWRLPEQLVWLPIAAAVLLLFGMGPIQSVSLWLLVFTTLLYSFQGLAVSLCFFEHWRLPVFVRVLAVFFLTIQGYGLMLLAILGVSDVWLNWRNRLKNRATGDTDSEK